MPTVVHWVDDQEYLARCGAPHPVFGCVDETRVTCLRCRALIAAAASTRH